MALKNEIGNVYGILTVLSREENDKNGKARWLCQCECGKQIVVHGTALRCGNTTSCGCRRLSAETAELGKRYGSLIVEAFVGRTDTKKILWKCKCDCGNYTEVTTGHLHSGVIKTCGKHHGGKNLVDETGNRYGKLLVLSRATAPTHLNSTSAFWLCRCDCGNETVVNGTSLRVGGVYSCGCVKSRGEYNIIQLLNANNISYQSQYIFDDLKFKDYLKYDFALLNEDKSVSRLIEFDGPQHQEGNTWYTNEVGMRDFLKNQYALSNNIPLIRIPYSKRDTLVLEDIITDKYLFKG